jgi:translocation and assembly module TamA
MPGTAINDVAPSRRFYAGGGSSIRGYGYELVGPRNSWANPKGGRSLYEFSLEARVNTPLMADAPIVPFIDAGGVETGTVPRMNDWRFGAGMGVRYKTGFGPIRMDIGTPLNPRAGDGPIGVYVALGQAF